MPRSVSEADDQSANDQWATHLDAFLTAIQQDDDAEQRRLLALEPRLVEWANPLREMDELAAMLTDSLTPDVSGGEFIQFGDYELRGELGRGGMGVVFRAYQHELDRTVALKMLTGGPFVTLEQRRRFAQEARLASRIRHPGIVAIHEVGEYGGQPYFTMDFVEGSDLASVLRNGPMSVDRAVEFLVQIVKAVKHLHQNGVIHRDLKPSNILLDGDGKPYVVDFGLARAIDGFHDATVTGTILGTPSYMSPEQAAGRVREISSRSDLYSLGAILYEMLCGRPPFVADSPFDTVLQVLEREPVSLRHWNPQIPTAVEQICLRCLEKSPDRRYASAGELAEELERWMRGEHSRDAVSYPMERVSRMVRRHPSAAYRLLGLLSVAFTVFVRCLIVPAYWSYYTPILMELGIWTTLTLAWEWLSHQAHGPRWTSYAFLLTDVICLTAILHVLRRADVSHVAAYVLIVLLAGLSLNRRLIAVASSGCVLGYLFLVIGADDITSWHVPVIMVILLICCHVMTDYQVRRLSTWIRPDD